jgi:hypothetical protein
MQGHAVAIASDHMARVHNPVGQDLHSFERGVDVSRRPSGAGFFAGHVPRFDGLPEFQLDASLFDPDVQRKAKLKMRIEPFHAQWIAGFVQVGNNVLKVLMHEVREHETVVNLRAPSNQLAAVRPLPQMSDQGAKHKVLSQAHS